LKDPKSVERGMGDVCANRNHRDAELAQREEYADEVDMTVPFSQALVMKRRNGFGDFEDGSQRGAGVITNIPHLVVHHSPSGYEWGYGGSGPADLALNVCQLYLNMTGYQGRKTKCYDGTCWTLAWMLHQEFKNAFIAFTPKNGSTVPFGEIDEWMKNKITVALLQQCAEDYETEEE
jgi:hypothetical protein